MKSLYYCRSLSIQRADNVAEKAVRPDELAVPAPSVPEAAPQANDEDCLACQ
jgi:ribonucleoside-diphosphate reductase alpha chain